MVNPTFIRQVCSRCREAFWLLARTVKGWLCAVCWRRLGEPPAAPIPPEERQRRKQETARRMQRRGGEAAYLLRSGRTGL